MTEQNQADRPGGAGTGPVFLAPGVVVALVLAMWALFIAEILARSAIWPLLDRFVYLEPARFFDPGVGWTRFVPLVGHMFGHGDFAHIGFNTLWLLAFATPVWRRFNGVGATGFAAAPFAVTSYGSGVATTLFLAFFIFGGVAGGLAFVALHPASTIPLVGASGAISACLGGMVRFAFRRTPVFTRALGAPIPLTDPVVLLWTTIMIVTNVAVGVFRLGVGADGPDISWEAHLGGYFFGLLAFPAFDAASRPKHQA